MKRFASIGVDGAILDGILTSNLSRLNAWPLNLTAFLVGHERFFWWLRIAELIL